MANKLGYDFGEFGGNVNVILVKSSAEALNGAAYLQSLKGDHRFEQLPEHAWSHFWGFHDLKLNEKLAKALSKELATQAIYFFFGDASGWLGYQLYDNGELTEDYSFGMDYSEEMAEAGIEMPEPERREGTVVTTARGDQFIFWSRDRSKTAKEITAGVKLIDEFLRLHDAYVGWDLSED